MVMEISIIPRAKLKIEAMARAVTTRGSYVFHARDGNIEFMSAQATLKIEIGGGSGCF